MSKRITYTNIDMQQTGRRLKYIIESAGYNLPSIQDSGERPQNIYRLLKGFENL